MEPRRSRCSFGDDPRMYRSHETCQVFNQASSGQCFESARVLGIKSALCVRSVDVCGTCHSYCGAVAEPRIAILHFSRPRIATSAWPVLPLQGRFMLKEGLKRGEYVVVHLRGGDKPWKCEAGCEKTLSLLSGNGEKCYLFPVYSSNGSSNGSSNAK